MTRESPRETGDRQAFRELMLFTGGGFISGLAVAVGLDALGWQRNPLGQWLVRTLAGEGESIFEGIFALSRRIRGAAGSLAEAYGWGKLLGMIAPWIIDFISRWLGLDLFGVQGFYIPFFLCHERSDGSEHFRSGLPPPRTGNLISNAATLFPTAHSGCQSVHHLDCAPRLVRRSPAGVCPQQSSADCLGNDCGQSLLAAPCDGLAVERNSQTL